MAIEEPVYKVLESHGKIELRQYEQYIVAETVVEALDLDAATSEGFGRLAGYIFGGNKGKAKIAMTAPVAAAGEKIAMTAPVAAAGAPGRYVIAFTMPAAYKLNTLPVPDDQRVTFREVPNRKLAAIRYSGTWSAARMEKKKAELLKWLAGKGLQPAGEPVFARYNPPWTPWFLRRNEVQVDLR